MMRMTKRDALRALRRIANRTMTTNRPMVNAGWYERASGLSAGLSLFTRAMMMHRNRDRRCGITRHAGQVRQTSGSVSMQMFYKQEQTRIWLRSLD